MSMNVQNFFVTVSKPSTLACPETVPDIDIVHDSANVWTSAISSGHIADEYLHCLEDDHISWSYSGHWWHYSGHYWYYST